MILDIDVMHFALFLGVKRMFPAKFDILLPILHFNIFYLTDILVCLARNYVCV